MSVVIDEQTVRKIARLSRLALSDKEVAEIGPQLSGILLWMEQLDEVNTDGILPMANVVGEPAPLREDVVSDGNCQEAVLANAPDATQGFFSVPKVVE